MLWCPLPQNHCSFGSVINHNAHICHVGDLMSDPHGAGEPELRTTAISWCFHKIPIDLHGSSGLTLLPMLTLCTL